MSQQSIKVGLQSIIINQQQIIQSEEGQGK